MFSSFFKNKILKTSINKLIIKTQSLYRTYKNKKNYNTIQKKILDFQFYYKYRYQSKLKNITKIIQKNKRMKQKNKYLTVFVDYNQLVIDIQKYIRRFLIQNRFQKQKKEKIKIDNETEEETQLYITNNTKIEEELESECYTYRTCDRDDATTTDYDSTEEEEEDKEIHFIRKLSNSRKKINYIFLRKKLIHFFKKYSIEKLKNVDKILNYLQKGSLSLNDLQKGLKQKYNHTFYLTNLYL